MNSANAFHLRRLGLAAPFLFLLLAGCGDYSAYPDDLNYPVRTDPIVKKPAQTTGWYPDPPGTIEDAKHQLLQLQKQQQALGDKVAKLNKEKDDTEKPPSADRLKAIEAELAKLDHDQKALDTPLNEARAKAWAETLLDPTAIPAVDPDPKDKDRRNGRDRTNLGRALEDIFGTPKGPTVSVQGSDTTLTQLENLKLNPTLLAQGSVLYRRYCLQCHGLTGDGHGPTGPWVHPHPRDYRQGVFKFVSTQDPSTHLSTAKPSRADLHHVLTTGVEGTSMPSFALLGDEALEPLISYVMHLSIRGEVELNLCKKLLKDTNFNPDSETLLDEAQLVAAASVKNWYDANKKEAMIAPTKNAPPSEEERKKSVERGYKLFIGAQAGCVKCHVDFGRQVPFKADDWGTPVRPANLTNNVYRGGRRPIDLYWRIRAGIGPSGMPAGEALMKDEKGNATDDDSKVWDVVNFVQALPYPAMLPEEVKKKIYEPEEK